MNTPLPEQTLADIKASLVAGQKINAIKQYRTATGAGLKEAKDAIEAMEAELRGKSPEDFKAPRAEGCFGVLLFAVMLLVAVLAWGLRR